MADIVPVAAAAGAAAAGAAGVVPGAANGTSTSSTSSVGTLHGEHIYTINGYSLVKGIGDGEPIASERFTVGGHEWALLFYPDGKKSAAPEPDAAPVGNGASDYCALFVALIGEGPKPEGIVHCSGTGRWVRAFHRFTLVDQSGNGRHVTKGRQRDQGAVKISCARHDPNARNCHGYRKFVRREMLESPAAGYILNDSVIIRYEIELVVMRGGGLLKRPPPAPLPSVTIPPPQLCLQLASLLETGEDADVRFEVEGEVMLGHRLVLAAAAPPFRALLSTSAGMREGAEGVIRIRDVRAPVFRVLLYFAYACALPAEHEPLDASLAQHLLAAADRFGLTRLRLLCESRLIEVLDAGNVTTTLMLAEQNHGEALKAACLAYVAAHLPEVMGGDGYRDMCDACPNLSTDILHAVATTMAAGGGAGAGGGGDRGGWGARRRRAAATAGRGPRKLGGIVRPRRSPGAPAAGVSRPGGRGGGRVRPMFGADGRFQRRARDLL